MLIFFDDILIYSRSLEEHQAHLDIVLTCLRQHKLYANKKKCTFWQPQLEYLEYIILRNGVAANRSKIEAISNWPKPRNL